MPIYDRFAFYLGLLCAMVFLFLFILVALLVNIYEVNILFGCLFLLSLPFAIWGWFYSQKNYRYISETGYHIVMRGKDICFDWEHVLGFYFVIIKNVKELRFELDYTGLDEGLKEKIMQYGYYSFSRGGKRVLREVGRFCQPISTPGWMRPPGPKSGGDKSTGDDSPKSTGDGSPC